MSELLEAQAAVGGCNTMLARGWNIAGSSYVKPGCAREFRVVLVNRGMGLKLFGFGADFAAAFADAQSQAGGR